MSAEVQKKMMTPFFYSESGATNFYQTSALIWLVTQNVPRHRWSVTHILSMSTHYV